MKAMILAAGLGTRLKPWTLSHPKALVPVAGVPMLERVIRRLFDFGFDEITVNVHHFSDQIVDFLADNSFGARISISDESDLLLDTGGSLLKAAPLIFTDDAPCLIHNVDILSDAPLDRLLQRHLESGRDISLVCSPRDSSRRLIFDESGRLAGWHNLNSDEYRPAGFTPADGMREVAFSGIYFVGRSILPTLQSYSNQVDSPKFPVMDFFLSSLDRLNIGVLWLDDLHLIDIGKPDTLRQANDLLDR